MEKETSELIEKFILRVKQDYEGDNYKALTPRRTLNYIMSLSGGIAWLAERIAETDEVEAVLWDELRPKLNSDKGADIAVKRTSIGIQRSKWRALLKGCESIVQACKKKLKLFESESQNGY